MKLKDYRKKAKELGGKLKVRSNSLGHFVSAVNADGIEIPFISSKEFHEANQAYYDLVNYAHPKGCELVMLPMLPWQAYSTIGWLTCTLPSRFSEYRRAAS